MNELIDQYIEDKRLAWAPSTLKSERARLNSVASCLDGNPLALWDVIQGLKPYSRLTLWTRVCDFWTFIKPTEGNPYEVFRKKNARLFKYVYQPKEVKITFEEARKRALSISNDYDRSLAFQILGSGERYREAIQDATRIIGKGAKPRDTYRPPSNVKHRCRSYSSFCRSLATVGLKAHDLRKLFATRLVESGISDIDLLTIMGWSSLATAKFYVQPKSKEKLKSFITKNIHSFL